MLPTMGPVRLRKLLEVFETPEQILGARGSELRKVDGIGKEVVEQIVNWEAARRSSGRAGTHSPSRRESDYAGVTGISAPAARDSCAADRSVCLGRIAGARSSRHRHHRLAPHDTLRNGIGEEAFLPNRLRRSHRDQRAGSRNRYRRASGRARGQRSHHRSDRCGFVESLSTGKRGIWPTKFAAETAPSFLSFRWKSNLIAKHFRCATASSADGATEFWWSKQA